MIYEDVDFYMNNIFNDIYYDLYNVFDEKPLFKKKQDKFIFCFKNYFFLLYKYDDNKIINDWGLCKICLKRKKRKLYMILNNYENENECEDKIIFCKHYNILKYIKYNYDFYNNYDINSNSDSENSF
jgi:hypothetical protein